MTQHDLTIDNDTRPAVRADITAALQALGSTSKGTARPATPYAGQLWVDDNTPSSTVWTLFLYTGSADIKIGEFNTTSNAFSPFVGASALSSVYALLNSPAFTGTPSLPTGATGVTQSPADNSTKLATTAYADAASGPGRFLRQTIYTSGSGTWTRGANTATIEVEICGAGGGGGLSAGAGGSTAFDSMTASGGVSGAAPAEGGAGGSSSGGDINMVGGASTGTSTTVYGGGGMCPRGGGGGKCGVTGTVGGYPGGGGGSSGTNNTAGSGGGFSYKRYTAPASASYSVGAAGSAGSGGFAGADGLIIVREFS